MKRRRVILLVVLGMAVTIGAVLLFAYVAMTGRFSGMIYRYTGSGKWLYSALYHGVEDGDSVEDVEGLLGPGKEGGQKVRGAMKKMAGQNPGSAGYEASDRVLGFGLPGGELYLQFREGVLINFDPGRRIRRRRASWQRYLDQVFL